MMFAEARSAADFQHGPMALIDAGYPLLILATREDVPTRDLTLPTAATPDLDAVVGAAGRGRRRHSARSRCRSACTAS